LKLGAIFNTLTKRCSNKILYIDKFRSDSVLNLWWYRYKLPDTRTHTHMHTKL